MIIFALIRQLCASPCLNLLPHRFEVALHAVHTESRWSLPARTTSSALARTGVNTPWNGIHPPTTGSRSQACCDFCPLTKRSSELKRPTQTAQPTGVFWVPQNTLLCENIRCKIKVLADGACFGTRRSMANLDHRESSKSAGVLFSNQAAQIPCTSSLE